MRVPGCAAALIRTDHAAHWVPPAGSDAPVLKLFNSVTRGKVGDGALLRSNDGPKRRSTGGALIFAV